MRLPNVLRAALAAFMAVAMPLDLSAQQMRPYFRWNFGPYEALPPVAPPIALPDDFEEGDGILKIYAPLQVRARYGVNFSLQIGIGGPTSGITWESIGSPLPNGLRLTQSGAIVGQPTEIVTASAVRIRATNSYGESGTSKPFIIDSRATPTVTVPSLLSRDAGQSTTIVPTKQEIWGSQTWRIDPTLPVGLSLNASTGAISGSPEQKGTFSGYRLSVTDADGATGTSNAFSIVVDSDLSIEGLQTSYAGRVGRAFTSVRPYVTGGSGTYGWTLSPSSSALPIGLTLNPSSGALTGNPTVKGETSKILLSAKDFVSQQSLTAPTIAIRIAGAPSVGTQPLYAGRVGRPMEILHTATDTLDRTSWTIDGPLLPGLTFTPATGRIEGTPTAEGDTTVSLRVVDLFDSSVGTSAPFTIRAAPALAVGQQASVKAKVGVPFELDVPQYAGLIGTPTWQPASGLPAGLIMIASTGRIQGTPTAKTTASVAYRLLDNADAATANSPPFQIQVLGEEEVLPFEVRPISVVLDATIGKPFAITPTTSGANGAVSWTREGPLPAWATFSPTTGTISGTPTAGQQYPNLRLNAADSSGATAQSNPFWIVVQPAGPLSVEMDSLTATEGVPFASARPIVRNDIGDLSFELAPGSNGLPDGMTVNPSTGAIQGTPVMAGKFDGILLQVGDTFRGYAYSSPFTVEVKFPGSLTYRNASGLPGDTIETFPEHAGLTAPITWALVPNRTLPSWATVDPSNGRVGGQPTELGVFNAIAVTATDALGRKVRSNDFSLGVVAAPVLTASMSDRKAVMGQPFSATPTVSGAKGGLTWRLDGQLPAGLSHNVSTGSISGTPTAYETRSGLVLNVTDDSGGTASTEPFKITVARSTLTAYGPSGAYRKHVGASLTLPRPSTSGQIGTVSWTVGGSLPDGLTLDASTGIVAGTATSIGNYVGIALTATDEAGGVDTTSPFSIEIVPAPSIEIASPLQARFGYDARFNGVARDTIGAVSWEIASGTLPSWMTLSASSGQLRGVPNAMGTSSPFTLRIVDGEGASATSGPVVVQVVSGMTVQLSPLAFSGRESQSFATAAPSVAGNDGDVTWRVASGTIPQWATLSPTTGIISGMPQEGTFTFSLTARDSSANEATTQIATVTIGPAPALSIASMTQVRVGAQLALAPSTTGARSPTTFSIVEGALPAWAAFASASGSMTGEATQVGTHSGLRIRMRDGGGADMRTEPFTIQATPGMTISNVPASVAVRRNAALPAINPTLAGAIGTPTWYLNSVPTGLRINAANGRIDGTPTASGGTSEITAIDAHDGAKARRSVTFDVVPTLTVTSATGLTSQATRAIATTAPGVSGLRGTPTWTIAEGTLPGWARIEANGSITGTPPTPQNVPLKLRVTDSWDQATATSETIVLDILDEPAVINMATSYTARFGSNFTSAPPTLANAIGTVTWSWGTTATKPAWLDLNRQTGRMSGTPTSLTSTTNLTIVGTDSNGSAQSVPFSINVLNLPTIAVNPSETKIRTGTAASIVPTVSGMAGSPIYELVMDSGSLPAGVSFVAATGRVTGTATASGTAVFRIKVTDSNDGVEATSQPVTLAVGDTLSVSGMPTAYTLRVGEVFQSPAPIATGVSGVATWSVTNRPTGLTGQPDGRLTGTPTAAYGPGVVTFTVSDNFDQRTASTSVSFRVLGALTVSGTSNLTARNNVDLALSSWTPSVTNVKDTQALRWELGSGTLPNGVTVNPTTGRLVGTPTGYAAQTAFTGLSVKAVDVDGQAFSTTFTITVYPQLTASIATTSYSTAAGTQVTTAIPTSAGIIGTRSWSFVTLSGVQPNAATSQSNGSVIFTPHAAAVGTWVFAIRVTDSIDGRYADTGAITVAISEQPALAWSQTSIAMRRTAEMDRLNLTPTPSGLVAPISYTLTGAPSGIGINASTGQLTGASATSAALQSYTLQVRATDSRSISVTSNLSLSLLAGPGVPYYGTQLFRGGVSRTADLPNPVSGIIGSPTFSIVNYLVSNPGQPYNIAVNASTGRLTFTNVQSYCDTNGGFFGAPSRSANHHYVKVTDSYDGAWAWDLLDRRCAYPLTITQQPTSKTFRAGVAQNTGAIMKVNSVVNYPDWTATGLPEGLSVQRTTAYSQTDGAIVGIPALSAARPEPYVVTMTATDPWDDTFLVSQTFTITVTAAADACPYNGPTAVTTCYCAPSETTSGSVWGTNTYMADSNICRAGVHMGKITTDGGTITVTPTAGVSTYSGSSRNGVSSLNYTNTGLAKGSFTVQ